MNKETNTFFLYKSFWIKANNISERILVHFLDDNKWSVNSYIWTIIVSI